MPGYKQVKEDGFIFLFRYDTVDPTILHIYARHLTSIDDALDLFFETEPKWNEKFKRFENYSDTHGLYWFWRDERKKIVVVITCFRI
ncbi:MAG: hypothetical protein R3F51_17110 [Cyanobacteriota/Melainabacteria group bacterium]